MQHLLDSHFRTKKDTPRIESRDKYFCVTGTESKRVPISTGAAIWNLDAGYKNVTAPIRKVFEMISHT